MRKVFALLGPTASGKTALCFDLAKKLNAEIVCLDSMLVYRGFDIGTAKPTKEEQKQLAHHVLDLIEAESLFTAHDYCEAASVAIENIFQKGKVPLLVGGSGFYLKALEKGMVGAPAVDPQIREALEVKMKTPEGRKQLYEKLQFVDPAQAKKIPIQNTHRIIRALEVFEATGITFSSYLAEHTPKPKWEFVKIGLYWPRKELAQRIAQRTHQMIQSGLLDEVRGLKQQHEKPSKPFMSVGYKESLLYLDGKIDEVALEEKINISTRQLAKRQMSWFRKDKEVHWFESNKLNNIKHFVTL